MKEASLKALSTIAVAALLTGCGGAGGNAALPSGLTQSAVAKPDKSILIYTANRDGASIIAFKAKANGNVAPVVTITGSQTELNSPDAMALDKKGNVYTANDSGTQESFKVYVFAAGSNGNAKPKRIVGGSKTNLGPTEGITLDSSDNLWVSNYSADAITEYKAGAKGNVKPIDTISGGNTQLNVPVGMVFDKTGRVYVANKFGASVVAFASGASGNATPVVSIAGSNTGLQRPFALAFDSNGRLLVADEDAGILVFASGANGNVSPVATITSTPEADGVVADAQNHIYAAGFFGPINEYASNANGYATPLRSIQGSKTTIDGANYLALH